VNQDKCLCQTEAENAVAWHSDARSLERQGIPREFTTRSRVVIISKPKSSRPPAWTGWSRNVLVHWIESDLHERQGKASTNFERSLPRLQSDLARELLRDPYDFQFLATAREAEEREIERGLVAHIQEFLIELGAGFAFLGKTKNQVVAEYALRDLAKPVGISSYVTRLVESLPKELRGSLPSPKELEAELEKSGDQEKKKLR
jgi:hypothetical protein